MSFSETCINFLRYVGRHHHSKLVETPRRLEKAWEFWTQGYNETNPRAILKEFNEWPKDAEGGNYDEMVLQANIRFYSHCEHHLAPFFGVVHIGYIPRECKYVFGLSKLARVVEMYARRLQMQERLTVEVANAIDMTEPEGVGVVVQARHMCLESRGVQKAGTITTTSALRGSIKKNKQARTEFLSFANAHQWNGV
jgi:GTP cyclohydrolase I